VTQEKPAASSLEPVPAIEPVSSVAAPVSSVEVAISPVVEESEPKKPEYHPFEESGLREQVPPRRDDDLPRTKTLARKKRGDTAVDRHDSAQDDFQLRINAALASIAVKILIQI